jgi:hypothetical protein
MLEPIEDSTHLAAAGWEDGVLTIEFRSGDTYQYFDVPSGVFHELMAAGSKGQYFRENIKVSFQYERIG